MIPRLRTCPPRVVSLGTRAEILSLPVFGVVMDGEEDAETEAWLEEPELFDEEVLELLALALGWAE